MVKQTDKEKIIKKQLKEVQKMIYENPYETIDGLWELLHPFLFGLIDQHRKELTPQKLAELADLTVKTNEILNKLDTYSDSLIVTSTILIGVLALFIHENAKFFSPELVKQAESFIDMNSDKSSEPPTKKEPIPGYL